MSDGQTRRDNFIYLLTALAFFAFALAVTEEFMPDREGPLLELVTLVTLLMGVGSTRQNIRVFRAGLALAAILMAVIVARLFIASTALTIVHGLTLVAFFSLTIWASLRQVLLTGNVDANCVAGAICIYVMSGINWAVIYSLEEVARPGSFHGLDVGSLKSTFLDMLYFSFATLTTVGYGDILPAHPIARILAMMETIVGQFYMAVLVATLVGARTTSWSKAE
jgi:hypothetical protein